MSNKEFWKNFKLKNKALYLLSVIVVIALFTILPMYLWITSNILNLGVTVIRGDSMVPSIVDNQIVYIDDLHYNRGDIVVSYVTNVRDYPSAYEVAFIKRIVGLPGEKVEIKEEGIYINDELLDESSYTNNPEKTYIEDSEYKELYLDADEYFLVGDNREDSFDSRHYGPVEYYDMLYGITTEMNDYTENILLNVILVALFNLSVMIAYPIVSFKIIKRNFIEKQNPKNNKKKKKR